MFTSSNVLAHLSQCIEVGNALRARGHDVIIAGDDPEKPQSRLSLAAQAGLRLAQVREMDQPYVWDRYMTRGWLATFHDLSHLKRWAPLDEILESQVELIRAERPECVVSNFTATVSSAAHIACVPCASLFNAYFLDYVLSHPVLRRYWRGYEWYHIRPGRRRIYRKYGRKPVDTLALFQSIPLFSPDLPGLYNVSNWLPNTLQTGPLLYDYPGESPEWIDELDDGTPNVYITMGSTGRFEAMLERIYPALGRSPYRFIVTTAGRVSDSVVDEAPANFRIARFAPGSEILRHCQAIIFHGGNGSMYQALSAGVPMLAIPTHLEQSTNARIGVRNGFCRMLSPRRATGEAILSELRELIEHDGYRSATQHWSQLVAQSDGANQAAGRLEQLAREGTPAGARIDCNSSAPQLWT
jgi:UDP:flavonoid glycosyltransferase YjiC (YdhE family)